MSRVIVSYDWLLADPLAALESISQCVGGQLKVHNLDPADGVEQLVEMKLKRQRSSTVPANETPLTASLLELYENFIRYQGTDAMNHEFIEHMEGLKAKCAQILFKLTHPGASWS